MSELLDFGLIVLVVAAGFLLMLLTTKVTERFPIPAPVLFLVYPLLLRHETGHPLGFLDAELDEGWKRETSWLGPIAGIREGLRAGWAGVLQLASGSNDHLYWTHVRDTPPLRVAAINLEQLAFLCLFVALTVIVWRRFGSAYGLYCAVSLAIPLSMPAERWPLVSIPRFGLVVFPFFLALASLGGRPRVHQAIVGASAIFLGVAVVQWALWQWVA